MSRTPRTISKKRTSSQNRRRTEKEREEGALDCSIRQDKNTKHALGETFCSQETLNEEDILAQVLPALKKRSKTASELVHELYKSSKPALVRNSARPLALEVSPLMDAVDSVVELAPNVEQFEILITPFQNDPQLPSWADNFGYALADLDDTVSNRWAPLPEKSPYGLLLEKHENEFRSLMNHVIRQSHC